MKRQNRETVKETVIHIITFTFIASLLFTATIICLLTGNTDTPLYLSILLLFILSLYIYYIYGNLSYYLENIE